MLQPVDQAEFWRDRIARAVREGREHYSVYLTHKTAWDKIESVHAEILARHVPSAGYKVLDAGCGYGRMSKYFTAEQYIGVDFSPDFIAAARVRHPDKRFVQSRLENLRMFLDQSFDVAFCVSMRAMITGNLGEPIWNRMERELKRVAKEVIILEYEDPATYWTL